MNVVVVVPTYNERGNIEPLIEGLTASFERVPHECEILIVDDNSPDGTGAAVEEMQGGDARIHLLRGEKQGLGVAYARGLDYALRAMHADAVVHMDADFSHDPADVPRLIAKLDEGYDMVVGARYIEGGGLPDDWGARRKLISRLANFGTRTIAGISSLHDCTNGYRAYRATVLSRVDLASAPPGYAVLTYLAYQMLMAGARTAEVPVVFSNRAEGTSKLRFEDAKELFLNVWWIRYDRRDRFLRYATGGLSGVAANLLVVSVLYYGASMAPLAASALATEASIIYSFAWRRMWARAVGRRSESAAAAFARTQALALPSFALSLGTFALLNRAGLPVVLSQAAAITPAMAWNYFIGDRLLDELRRMKVLNDRPAAEHLPEEIADGSAG